MPKPPPQPGEPGYEAFRKKYNERRRERRQDPDYRAAYSARATEQRRRREAANPELREIRLAKMREYARKKRAK
ncbi:Uncharacterised protein [Mycobacteroides abscessus subsp. massiliense]|nr:Uncharacterised protein [Mycobacteroides abscessus subsp. massiliense]